MAKYQHIAWAKAPVMTANVRRRDMETLILRRKLPVTLKVELRLGDLSTRAKNRVVNAVLAGVLPTYCGVSAQVYEVLCKATGLPSVLVSNQNKPWHTYKGCVFHMRGTYLLPLDRIQAFVDGDRAAAKIADVRIDPTNDGRLIHYPEFGGYARQHLFVFKTNALEMLMQELYTPELKERAVEVAEMVKQGKKLKFTY